MGRLKPVLRVARNESSAQASARVRKAWRTRRTTGVQYGSRGLSRPVAHTSLDAWHRPTGQAVSLHGFNTEDHKDIAPALRRVDKHYHHDFHLKEIRNTSGEQYMQQHGATGLGSIDNSRPMRMQRFINKKVSEGETEWGGDNYPAFYHPKNKTIVTAPEHTFIGQHIRDHKDVGSLVVHELGHAADPELQKSGRQVKKYMTGKDNPRNWSKLDESSTGQYQTTNPAEDFAEGFRHHIGIHRHDGDADIPSQPGMFGHNMPPQARLHTVTQTPDRNEFFRKHVFNRRMPGDHGQAQKTASHNYVIPAVAGVAAVGAGGAGTVAYRNRKRSR